MNNNKLTDALKKVYFKFAGVEDYFIFWKCEDHILSLEATVKIFKSVLLSSIKLKEIDFQKSEFIIRNPEDLLSLLSIADEEVTLIYERQYDSKLTIKDSNYEQVFILCDPNTPGRKPERGIIEEEPLSYDFVLHIDDEFANKFIKAKKANKSEVVTLEVKDRKATFQLGEDNGYTNKTRFFIEEDGMFDMEKISFSSDMIQSIFEKNKGMKGQLSVSDQGLMKIEYRTDKVEIRYFLAALDEL